MIEELDLPYADAAVAAILLEHPSFRRGRETSGEPLSEVVERAIELDVGAPSQLARSVEHSLCSHPHDDVGVCGDEDTHVGDLAEELVQCGPVIGAGDRVDPHQREVRREQVAAYVVEHVLGED